MVGSMFICDFLLRRFCKFFRQPRPTGSLPAFAARSYCTPIHSITEQHLLFPASFTRCPNSLPCGIACPQEGGTSGLPCSV